MRRAEHSRRVRTASLLRTEYPGARAARMAVGSRYRPTFSTKLVNAGIRLRTSLASSGFFSSHFS